MRGMSAPPTLPAPGACQLDEEEEEEDDDVPGEADDVDEADEADDVLSPLDDVLELSPSPDDFDGAAVRLEEPRLSVL